MFKRYSQFCRSAFKRKEGRKVVTWNRGREAKGPEDQWYWTNFIAGNAVGEQQKGFKSMEKLESLENNPKGREGGKRQRERMRISLYF